MFDWDNVVLTIFAVFAILLILIIIVGIGYGIWCDCTKVEVEVYSVGCEITQMAYAEEQVSKASSRPVYKMGVRCDDFACTFNITDVQFAMFAVGDAVEVEVTVWEYRDGTFDSEYRLLGALQE